MHSIVQLEASVTARPNSIEINQALADAYATQGRWQEAAEAYRSLLALYPATASLFVNRIRLGAVALAISSVLILAAQFMQASLKISESDAFEFAKALASKEYFFSQVFILIAFPFLSTAAISIYKLLSYSRDHRPAFWAMVFSVIGIGLSMPSLGINAVVLPVIGRFYLDGEPGVLKIHHTLQEYPWVLILQFGSYLLLTGIMIFSWVIWRSTSFPKWAATLYLTGWILFIASVPPLTKFGLISTGILIVLGGIGLARSFWIQAPLQFTPAVDSAQRADS